MDGFLLELPATELSDDRGICKLYPIFKQRTFACMLNSRLVVLPSTSTHSRKGLPLGLHHWGSIGRGMLAAALKTSTSKHSYPNKLRVYFCGIEDDACRVRVGH